MANSLGIDLAGKIVVVKAQFCPPGTRLRDWLFLCENGFGLMPFTSGQAVLGKWLASGKGDRIEGSMIERLATDAEKAEFEKKEEVKPDQADRK